MLTAFALYLLTGLFVGFVAGLLGIGGGLVIVPILSYVLSAYAGIEDPIHFAIATSLATIFVTSFSSVRAHHQLQNVNWDTVRAMSPGLFLGAVIGSLGASALSQQLLSIIFGLFTLLIALNMIMGLKPKPLTQLDKSFKPQLPSFIIGSLSTLIGIGGGTLSTPYLTWKNVSMHQAIGVSAALAIPISLAGAMGYMIFGLNETEQVNYSTGYVYWPAFIGIVLTSVFTAPMGAKLSGRLPTKKLKLYFAGLLILVSLNMFIF